MTQTIKSSAVWPLRIGTASLIVSVLMVSPLLALTDPIRTTSGLVSGSGSEGVGIYRGIPYAAPPVGDLRWRPPQPDKSWTGVRAATEFGADCMRRNPGGRPQSEDCLFLNIVTPARTSADKLPVMVWIHGGGFHSGSGAADQYPSEPLPRRGIVLVTFNYRLNVFGFLAHAALTAESPQHSSGNYGLLDQIAALKWVQANIEAFGGDPGRVTIFGASAGATSVCRLILSPLAKGLFHRAIAQSPASEFQPLRTLSEAEKQGEFWGNNVQSMRAAAAADLTARTKAALGPNLPGGPAAFWPIVDGMVIPAEDVDLYRTGKLNVVPLIIGHNTDDMGSIFRSFPATTLDGFRAGIYRWFGQAESKVLARYPATNDTEAHEALGRLLGDLEFIYASGATARAMSQWQKVFRYHFTRRSGSQKAVHGAEGPYVWGSLELLRKYNPTGAIEPADQTLSEAMMSAWVRFAGSGDPNGGKLPSWPAYTRANDAHMEFGNVITVGSGLHAETIDFWDEIFDGR